MSLFQENAERVTKETPPLSREGAESLAHQVPDWALRDTSIERVFQFPDFTEAMKFVNKVAEIAQEQDHHPDIRISYNKVSLEFSTHRIGGLSRNDFILAARVDRLANARKEY